MRALGIDIGTTSISAVVAETGKRELERSFTIANGSFMKTDSPWEKIQDPDSILQTVFKLLEEIFKEYKDIEVIGLTGQMHGIVYLDEEGKHVSPLYTWQDGRGNLPVEDERSICEILEKDFSIKAYSGYGLVTHLYHCKKGLVPEKAVKVCTIMDYLGMRLTGRKTPLMHSSNGAGLGLYDVERNLFHKEILRQNGADTEILPEITDEFTCIGTWRGIPVSVAIGDNQASFLGSVEEAESSVLVNMGTGGQISVLSEKYFTAKGIEARPFVKGYYLLAGSSLCGGRAYACLESFFRSYAEALGVGDIDHYGVMGKLLDKQEKSGSLKVLTTFSGTREHPEKRGTIKDIGTDNFTPEALILGVLEGMASELYKMYGRIQKGLSFPGRKIIASGNGIRKNRHLQEIMSKKFDMYLELAKREEEAAYGAALCGMITAGSLTFGEAVGIR